MSKELFTYIQKRAVKWEREKTTDKSMEIVTKIITGDLLTIYKKGLIHQEDHMDPLLDIKIAANTYVLNFCLDEDTEEEILNGLKAGGYELIEEPKKWFHNCIITANNEEEVKRILENFLWKHTPGLLY